MALVYLNTHSDVQFDNQNVTVYYYRRQSVIVCKCNTVNNCVCARELGGSVLALLLLW